jgi:preprotein translocase subunit SecD
MHRRSLAATLAVLVIITTLGATGASAAPAQATVWSWLLEQVWSRKASRDAQADRKRTEAALRSQGGSRLLIKVDTDALRDAMLIELRDGVRLKLRDARIAFADLAVRQGSVEVRIREQTEWERARGKLATLSETIGWDAGSLDLADRGEGALRLTPTDDGFADRLRRLRHEAIEVIGRRLAGFGIDSPGVYPDGSSAIQVLLPGVKDPERASATLSKRARITFRLVDESMTAEEALQGNRPPGSEIRYLLNDRAPLLLRKQVVLEGADIADAAPGFDQRTQEPIVTFRFNAKGTRRFAQITEENVGRPFAIVLDDDVLSAPIIREPIVGGSGQISGGFTLEQANTVAVLLRSGMLPGHVAVVGQQVVEPENKSAQQ